MAIFFFFSVIDTHFVPDVIKTLSNNFHHLFKNNQNATVTSKLLSTLHKVHFAILKPPYLTSIQVHSIINSAAAYFYPEK